MTNMQRQNSVKSQTKLLRRLGLLFNTLFKVRLSLIIILLFAAVFIFSATMLILDYTQGAKEEDAFRQLAAFASGRTAPLSTANDMPVTAPAHVSADEKPAMLPQYLELYEQNKDMAGWIKIDGTGIDYPVMYTPGDSEFYLSHGFDKTQTKSGVPFIDSRCSIDPFGTNTIIYGHHMKNGTMFAGLERYKDEEYCKTHPFIRFSTLYKEQRYEVIAVFESKIFKQNDETFKYYNFINADDEDDFDMYIENIKALSLYDTGVTAFYGDKLLTLVTCDYHVDSGRFVVVAINIL